MGDPVKVLMAGSATKVKGGMTTVVNAFLDHRFSSHIQLVFIPSHSEKGRVYNSFYFLKSFVLFLYHLLFKAPDVVHLHMSDKGSFIRKYILFKVSQVFRKPVIVHAHGGDFRSFYARMPNLLKPWVHDLLKNAQKVIALGGNWKKILMEIEPEADVEVLMNAVPMPDFDAPEHKKDFTVLFLAVMNESKGILDLIIAADNIFSAGEAQSKNLIFDIAGDGEMLEEAKGRVKRKGMEQHFRFHGWVDSAKKEELLRRADLFVLPSYFEGLPMSILEAVSHGIPVIATDVGSIDEAVVEGENGYLIEPGNVKMLTERLKWILDDTRIGEMRMASRRIAEEKFDEKEYFQQMENLYTNCYLTSNFHYNRKSS
ncbi:glycosyltransferase [Planococcus sp. X10-3]|uniref:glycosyltransferase n=1 Tax=Planococcus sp. X10-3 TaxID=3061240 RepID=UPI003BB1B18D